MPPYGKLAIATGASAAMAVRPAGNPRGGTLNLP
jgi:hypothetical protein